MAPAMQGDNVCSRQGVKGSFGAYVEIGTIQRRLAWPMQCRVTMFAPGKESRGHPAGWDPPSCLASCGSKGGVQFKLAPNDQRPRTWAYSQAFKLCCDARLFGGLGGVCWQGDTSEWVCKPTQEVTRFATPASNGNLSTSPMLPSMMLGSRERARQPWGQLRAQVMEETKRYYMLGCEN
eukprot:647859-Pelagomonas_calceolata.AAC.3